MGPHKEVAAFAVVTRDSKGFPSSPPPPMTTLPTSPLPPPPYILGRALNSPLVLSSSSSSIYMGACLSSSFATIPTYPAPKTAKVVAVDGSLREYSSEVKVREVLALHHPPAAWFICSSDELYCNTKIPALRSQDSLKLGQLYFVLPVVRLGYPLSGSDMAALAIKASVALSALAAARSKGHAGRRAIQVMPVAAEVAGGVLCSLDDDDDDGNVNREGGSSGKLSTSTSLKRSASFRGNSRLRRRYSYKEIRLSTIEEVAE
ncbi:hypothetical protein Cni_G28307 [Canna indica]|uniref:Uncharacterized protein n=1 Tax=Canna indica TaxID=4628 RepID=A0AAQ3L381_9LILI|nr:hypothetical protein Cni_G28307 [Canna indica]